MQNRNLGPLTSDKAVFLHILGIQGTHENFQTTLNGDNSVLTLQQSLSSLHTLAVVTVQNEHGS